MNVKHHMTCAPVSFADANFSAYCPEDGITPKLPSFTKLVFSGVPFERAARAVADTPEEYEILAEVFVRLRSELMRTLSMASREGQFAGAVLGNASKTTLDHATGHPSISATDSVGADSH